MTTPAISVKNLSCEISGVRILDGVSFTVEPGEIRAVIGPNGAGKSTCARCLSGLEKNWTGTIELSGTGIHSFSRRELAARICYLPQVRGIPPAFTAREFVGMGRYAHSGPKNGLWGSGPAAKDARIVDASLEAAGVSHLADRLLPTLSGGEMQMVHIAAALAQEAGIFVLDEPATFLDPKRHELLLSVIARLNARHGIAMLVITHDVNVALHASRRVLALKAGRTAYDGPSSGLMNILGKIFEMNFGVATAKNGEIFAYPVSLAEQEGLPK